MNVRILMAYLLGLTIGVCMVVGITALARLGGTDARTDCVDSGRIAIVRDVAGEIVVTACLSIDELEGTRP